MSETSSIEKPARPSWELPSGINIVVIVFSTALGFLGLAVDLPKRFQPVATWISWPLLALSLGLFGAWLLRRVVKEGGVLLYRIRKYDALYNEYLREQQRTADEQGRVRYLVQHVIRTVATLDQVATFDLANSILVENDVFVTLAGNADPPLLPQDTLMVFDPTDAMWLANLEVTSAKTPSDQWIVKMTAWDAVFLTYLRRSAQQRRSLDVRAKAYRFPSETDQEYK